jgi:hypothetical protein
MNILIDEGQLIEMISEMAVPDLSIREKLWFHGTNQENGEKILESGIIIPNQTVTKKSRAYMNPIYNKTYFTADLHEAIRYALFRGDVGQSSYVFAVSGSDLKDVQPDEDIIADLIQTEDTIKGFEWLIGLAKRVNSEKYKKFLRNGDYFISVSLAKDMVKNLTDEQKIMFINKGLKLAHEGEIKFSHAWELPQTLNARDFMMGGNIEYYLANMFKLV